MERNFNGPNALQQREHHYLLKSVNDLKLGYWEYDVVNSYLYWCPVTKKIHGVPPDYVPNLESAISFYGDDHSRRIINEAVHQGIDHGKSWDVELFIINTAGEKVEVRAKGEVERDKSGNVVRILGIFQDISKFKSVDAHLSQASKELELIQKQLKIGHWHHNLQENRLMWSDSLLEIFEVRPQNFVPTYEAFLQFVHPEDKLKVDKEYRASLEGKTRFQIDYRIRCKSGKLKWVQTVAQTFYDDKRRPIETLGTAQDVTELIENREQFKNLMGEVPVAIILIDSQNVIKQIYNIKQLLRFFPNIENTPMAITGSNIIDLLTKYPQLKNGLLAYDKKNTHKVVSQSTGGGHSIMVEMTVTPLSDSNHVLHFLEVNGQLVVALDSLSVDGPKLSLGDSSLDAFHLQTLIKHSRFGFSQIDIINNRVFWDSGTYELFGIVPGTYLEAGSLIQVISDRKQAQSIHMKMQAAIKDQGCKFISFRYPVKHPGGEVKQIETRASFNRDSQGHTRWITCINFDVTEIVSLGQHNQALLQEVHHRVKNNFQIISSLIGLQLGHLEDGNAKNVLKDMQARLFSMSIVHEGLFHSKLSGRIDVEEYVKSLASFIVHHMGQNTKYTVIPHHDNGAYLPPDKTVYLGLIINELMTNSIKYSSAVGSVGIYCDFWVENDQFNFFYWDEGPYYSTSYIPDVQKKQKGLGLELIEVFVKSLKASADWENQEHNTSRRRALRLSFATEL